MAGRLGSILGKAGKGFVSDMNHVAGGLSGMAGYFTGLGPQVEEAAAAMRGETANHSIGHMFKNSSGMAGKHLGIADLALHSIEQAPKGKGFNVPFTDKSYKFSGGAKAIILGLAGASAVKNVVNESYKDDLGQVDTVSQTPPSMTYDYTDVSGKDDNGADGGLVFSLNKLRHG